MVGACNLGKISMGNSFKATTANKRILIKNTMIVTGLFKANLTMVRD